MGLFDSMLKDNESLFAQGAEMALDFDFMPKKLLFRENEQNEIAYAIKPLFAGRDGSHLIIHGPPGVGKTVACTKVLEEVDDNPADITTVFVNTWQHNSTYKIVLEMCKAVRYLRTANRNTSELMDEVIKKLNKDNGAAVLVFDEIDKAQDLDFLYTLLERVYKKTIILITNYKETIAQMDERIRSRLNPTVLAFDAYNRMEVEGILRHRKDFAFVPDVFEEDAFQDICNITYDLQDIRKGLFLMKEAANAAERRASKKITQEHAQKALEKVQEYTRKNPELDTAEKAIVNIVKQEKDIKIGEAFKLFEEQGNSCSYKTFQRKIDKLEKASLIHTTKTQGGKEGNTTILHSQQKTLQEF